jgi:multisubunit Na+/H+ antiporter MnhC subunit
MIATYFIALRPSAVRVVTTFHLSAYRANTMILMISANLHGFHAPSFSSIQLMPRSLKNE